MARELLAVGTVLAWAALGGPAARAEIVVCVDPGHGGTDPGAVGCGLEEAAVNLDVALRLRDLLLADPDLAPVMTRTADTTVSLGARTAFANDAGAARFASIHSNSATPAATGIETYCASNGSAASFDQRDRIQEAMVDAWPLTDRGGKTAGFYVLVNTAMPATLTELGFITNCAKDATWLGSPVERQIAAQAHLDALRKSLGLGAGTGGGTGILRGVVFEDQGVGTADMSVRLPGAKVAVTGPGVPATATADDPEGGWLFDRPPGAWTVTASLAGYAPASRTCAVTAGATTWCAVGLFPAAPAADPEPTPDVAEPGPDVAETAPDTAAADPGGPEVGPELPPADTAAADTVPQDVPRSPDTAPPPDTAGPPADTAAPPDAPPAAAPRALARVGTPSASVRTQAEEGCAGGGGGAGEALAGLGLALALALARRRARGCPVIGRPAASLGATVVALAALATAPGCDPRAGSPDPAPAPPAEASSQAALTAGPDAPSPGRPLALADLRRVTAGSEDAAPAWSPDGRWLAFTRPAMDRLSVVSAEGGDPRVLVEAPGAGYAPAWLPDGRGLAWRAPGQRRSDVPLHAVGLDGRALPPPANPTPGRHVVVRDDAVLRVAGGREERISPPGDRYCCAAASPDGARVAFLGLTRGLFVHDAATGRTTALGPGLQPAWSADGRRLAFVRQRDDGERVTDSALLIADLDGPSPVLAPVEGAPPGAAHPTLSPDGRRLAFDAGGALWTARLEAPR